MLKRAYDIGHDTGFHRGFLLGVVVTIALMKYLAI